MLGIQEVEDDQVLQKVNENRRLLGLVNLERLDENVSFKAGVDTTQDDIVAKYPQTRMTSKTRSRPWLG